MWLDIFSSSSQFVGVSTFHEVLSVRIHFEQRLVLNIFIIMIAEAKLGKINKMTG